MDANNLKYLVILKAFFFVINKNDCFQSFPINLADRKHLLLGKRKRIIFHNSVWSLDFQFEFSLALFLIKSAAFREQSQTKSLALFTRLHMELPKLISGVTSSRFLLFQHSAGWAAVPSMTLLALSPPNPPVNLPKSFITNNVQHNNWLYCTYTYILLPVKDYRSGHKRWESPHWLFFSFVYVLCSQHTDISLTRLSRRWVDCIFNLFAFFFSPGHDWTH